MWFNSSCTDGGGPVSESHSRADEKPPSDVKKAYTSPKLIEYGNVSKLTMTKGQTNTEGGIPNMRLACL